MYLAEFLRKLITLPGSTTIHLVAHSMGNRLLTYALELLGSKGQNPNTGASFRQIVLTAPDIDVQEFRFLASAITPAVERATVYSNPHDKALVLSRHLHEYPRLGETITVLPQIDTIDASAVDTSFLCHSAYGDNRTVLTDIDQLLRSGASPNDRTGIEQLQSHEGTYYRIRP